MSNPASSGFSNHGLARAEESQWQIFSILERPRVIDKQHADLHRGSSWVTLIRIDRLR